MFRTDRNILEEKGTQRHTFLSAAVTAILLAGCITACLPAVRAGIPADETEAESENTIVDDFLADIGAAENDRLALADSYTNAELRMMTNDEIAKVNQECCESERWFADRYSEVQFEDRNIQYLCDQYLAGLQNQYDAYDSWQEKQDIEAYNELWEAGFAKRAVVVMELKEFYGVGFLDVSDMEAKADELETLDELKSGNVSSEMAKKVQECLNALGFPVGPVDGYCGYRTIQMVRRFQKLYGYGPADGVIDEELVGQLEEEVQKAAPQQEETEHAEA